MYTSKPASDFMKFSVNNLFHYTSFDSALKIISSNTLKFGLFENMNDVAEVKREYFTNIDIEEVEFEMKKYKSISFTWDDSNKRGYEIDSLWGYYAQKGNGVCLVFDKSILLTCLEEKSKSYHKRIEYLNNFSNAIPLNGNNKEEVSRYIAEHIDDLFFTKSLDWKHEHEYRFLLYSSNEEETLFLNNSLLAIILCMPKRDEIEDTLEYKILSKLIDLPILHYKTCLGEKGLFWEGQKLYPVLGRDYNIDI